MDEYTTAIVSLLAGRGHNIWFAGASARHQIGGHRAPHSADLLSDASAEVCAEVRTLAADVLQEGSRLSLQSLGDQDIESMLRTRGVTIEALAISAAGELVDPVGGLAHLQSGVLRTVQAPDRAFRDTPELLIRVGRIISETGFSASNDLRRFATRDAGNLLDIPSRNQAWGREMNPLLLGYAIDPALQWLQDTGALRIFLPEIAAMIGFDKTCAVHHKDLWSHTKLVTQKASCDLVVRWAALCHDIGKVWTRSVNRQGKVHFFRHEEHGALLFESIAHRLCLDEWLTKRVAYLIEHHTRVNLYHSDWTDNAVRRLIRDTEGHLQDLLTFSKADFTTKRESRIAEMKATLAELEERIARIRDEDAQRPPLETGVGSEIMEHFGLKPSRTVGTLKKLLESAVEAGTLVAPVETAFCLSWLSQDTQAIELIQSAGGSIPLEPDSAQDG